MDVPRSGVAASRRRKTMIMAAIATAALAALFVALGFLRPTAPEVPRDSVIIQAVQSGTMLRQVRGPGLLVPEDQRWLTALTSGRVDRILQRPGDTVTPDTVVAVLSNPEVSQQVEDARFALQASEAETAALRLKLNSELMQQRVRVASVLAAAESARLQAEAEAEAARAGAVSRLQMQRTALQSTQLQGQYEVEVQLQAELAKALQAQVRAQVAKERQLARALALRQDQERSLQVLAGMSGRLQTVLVQEGQQVAMGANIARVARPDRLMAQLRIPEAQAKDLRTGLSVKVDVRSAVVDGRVRRVSPAVEQGTVLVEVELPGTLPAGARADTSVDGIIDIDVVPNAVYVARPAGVQPESTSEVFRLDARDVEAERVAVRFGRASVANILVLDGLRPGDRILTSDVSQWAGFDRIRLE
jgi:HlyD family secretion protein